MTQEGFEDYVHAVYGINTGTANSYIKAIHIIDEMFKLDDVFALNGISITKINDTSLLDEIVVFVCKQQNLFKKGEDSFFRNISPRQRSYPGKGFCSAAIKQLLEYHCKLKEREADRLVIGIKKPKDISQKLRKFFDLDKDGIDIEVSTTARLGQGYFRKMVLENYENKCCVTGLNIPQTLRASHIVAWADDKQNRMNPENGLCLSATYDAAFDKHLISFDDDYRMIVSKEIKEFYANEVVNEYFAKYEGKAIIVPKLFLPNKKLLEKHRSLLVG